MNTNKAIYPVIILILFLTSDLFSQSCSIEGTVMDVKNSEAIKFAKIKLINESSGITHMAVSDIQGRYSFDSLPEGIYKITVLKNGFSTEIMENIKISSGRVLVVDIFLTFISK